ncbi:prepilin-type N-terminal cleavage/methylation domain-containing protein (plasmid) [Deinococcus wulumuqiensis]|uniref:Prepilin-type N-terminal cleavage/methylation domain-containing protein n=1 Tax=Deinococcus wulumuqiensis TaxID=980427 RepID=A0A345IM83_9DEIO|nr:prepilin-type N-terminal cleavage/methylation domain-containing protein [Deinococcus wulumuqiensis]
MEPRRCKRQKPTTPNSAVPTERVAQQGFTLIELLVSMGLLGILLLVVFSIFMSSNNLIETDTSRVNATQNTQSAMDLLASDVRQAGENLDLSLGVSGLEFNASSLTIRRSIPPLTALQAPSTEPTLAGQTVKTMSVCSLNTSTKQIQIVGPPPSTSSTAPTATTTCTYSTRPDGEDANVKIWRVYFAAEDNRPQVGLLVRPKTSAQTALIERVAVVRVEATQTQNYGSTTVRRVFVTLRDPIPAGFSATNGSTLTLIDERRYLRDSTANELRLALGGQTDTEAAVVAFNVTDFTTTALLGAAGTSPEETVSSLGLTGPWSRVKKVNLSLTAGNSGTGRSRSRTFTTSIFPRNVESAQ